MIVKIGGELSPGFKFTLALIVALVLTVPLFSIWLLVYDRKSQSDEARASITEGWGTAQVISGPDLVIPYRAVATETVVQNGQPIMRSNEVTRELTLAPESMELATNLMPEVRKRSIYEAVVYRAHSSGLARFGLPADLASTGIDPSQIDLSHAELRFAISDPRGLEANPRVTIDNRPLRLQPGAGSSGGSGFFAWMDARPIVAKPLIVDFAFDLRGNESLSVAPEAGDMRWTVRSSWPSPSFGGEFLPALRGLGKGGFFAAYRVGNLALGRSLISTNSVGHIAQAQMPKAGSGLSSSAGSKGEPPKLASISLLQPVDVYSQVNRATKYGFLFIGFTFLALLMFDVIGGVAVSAVEYLLMGAALILFFVLLLAFAEVTGFTSAYVLASAAIAGLNSAYSAAVLESWRRASLIGGLLAALYSLLYILLSLEAYSLLIGAMLLFAALAVVMFLTRRIDWSAPQQVAARG